MECVSSPQEWCLWFSALTCWQFLIKRIANIWCTPSYPEYFFHPSCVVLASNSVFCARPWWGKGVIQGAHVRNGAQMWGGCLCAGTGLSLQPRPESPCGSTYLQGVQGLVPRGASSFPSARGVHGFLGPGPSFLGGKAVCLCSELCLARGSVLELGLMPDFSQTASWPAMGAGLLREPCLEYQGQEEPALTETFSCDFKFSFLHRYKMQSSQSKLCQGCVS